MFHLEQPQKILQDEPDAALNRKTRQPQNPIKRPKYEQIINEKRLQSTPLKPKKLSRTQSLNKDSRKIEHNLTQHI